MVAAADVKKLISHEIVDVNFFIPCKQLHLYYAGIDELVVGRSRLMLGCFIRLVVIEEVAQSDIMSNFILFLDIEPVVSTDRKSVV